jgi:hypothetical protein
VLIHAVINESGIILVGRDVFHKALLGDVERVARNIELLTNEIEAFRADSLFDRPHFTLLSRTLILVVGIDEITIEKLDVGHSLDAVKLFAYLNKIVPSEFHNKGP